MSSEMSTVSVGLVRLHRHFNKLPEDSQGNLAVRELFISYHQSQFTIVSM